MELIPEKLNDRKIPSKQFLTLFNERLNVLTSDAKLPTEFKKEMQRFLPKAQIKTTMQNDFWEFIVNLVSESGSQLKSKF